MAQTRAEQASSRARRLVGALMLVWGLRWLFGPVILLLGVVQMPATGGPLPLAGVGFRWLSGVLGVVVAFGAMGAGLLLLVRGREGPAAGMLGGAIAYQALFVFLPPIGRAAGAHLQGGDTVVPGLLALLGGQVALGDLGCAAALLWFIARALPVPHHAPAEPPPAPSADSTDPAAPSALSRPDLAPVVTLAVLVLLLREGLRAPTAYLDALNFWRALGPMQMPAAYALTLGPGVVASVGAVLLLVARLLRWRGLGPAAAALMVFAMVRLVAQLALPGSHTVPPTTLGAVMQVGIYVTALAAVAEYLLLVVHLPDK